MSEFDITDLFRMLPDPHHYHVGVTMADAPINEVRYETYIDSLNDYLRLCGSLGQVGASKRTLEDFTSMVMECANPDIPGMFVPVGHSMKIVWLRCMEDNCSSGSWN